MGLLCGRLFPIFPSFPLSSAANDWGNATTARPQGHGPEWRWPHGDCRRCREDCLIGVGLGALRLQRSRLSPVQHALVRLRLGRRSPLRALCERQVPVLLLACRSRRPCQEPTQVHRCQEEWGALQETRAARGRPLLAASARKGRGRSGLNTKAIPAEAKEPLLAMSGQKAAGDPAFCRLLPPLPPSHSPTSPVSHANSPAPGAEWRYAAAPGGAAQPEVRPSYIP